MHRIASLLLVVLLGLSAQALAFDSGDPFGVNTQVAKPAKAPREKNDGRWLENQVTGFAAGAAAGAAANVTLGGAAAALNPVVALPVIAGLTVKLQERAVARESVFYTGTVSRGRVVDVFKSPSIWRFSGAFGIDESTYPNSTVFKQLFDIIKLDVDGPSNALVFAFVPKELHVLEGDLVDVEQPVGMFTQNVKIYDALKFDFNRHAPRVVNVYCKHNNPACQNDYDSSLGVIARPNLTEFPPSQYLIDPAIIAADQAKMRKEEEEKKAARNSGGFSFL